MLKKKLPETVHGSLNFLPAHLKESKSTANRSTPTLSRFAREPLTASSYGSVSVTNTEQQQQEEIREPFVPAFCRPPQHSLLNWPVLSQSDVEDWVSWWKLYSSPITQVLEKQDSNLVYTRKLVLLASQLNLPVADIFPDENPVEEPTPTVVPDAQPVTLTQVPTEAQPQTPSTPAQPPPVQVPFVPQTTAAVVPNQNPVSQPSVPQTPAAMGTAQPQGQLPPQTPGNHGAPMIVLPIQEEQPKLKPDENKKNRLILDYFYYALEQAIHWGLKPRQTHAYFQILQHLMQRVMETHVLRIHEDYQYFKEQLIDWCIHRPPYSERLFNTSQMENIHQYLYGSLFFHYPLYKHSLCRKPYTPPPPPTIPDTIVEETTTTADPNSPTAAGGEAVAQP